MRAAESERKNLDRLRRIGQRNAAAILLAELTG
jgi:hypothetical protein